MHSVIKILADSPDWMSGVAALLTLGGAMGMYIMLKIAGSRMTKIEETCKERMKYCGSMFQKAGEADIRHDETDRRLERIEEKLDHIILKNGWS